MFLLARLCRSNRGRMADSAFDPQLLHQVHKPLHRSSGFDADKHGVRERRIEFPHFIAFVHQRQIHHFSRCCLQHR